MQACLFRQDILVVHLLEFFNLSRWLVGRTARQTEASYELLPPSHIQLPFQNIWMSTMQNEFWMILFALRTIALAIIKNGVVFPSKEVINITLMSDLNSIKL